MAPRWVCNSFLLFNLSAIAALLAWPGEPVPRGSVLFVAGTLLYAALANSVADKPTVASRRTLSPSPFIVRLFFPCTLTFTLGTPWALLLTRNAPAALLAPHLFVMHCQLAAETLTYLLSAPPYLLVSAYVRVAIPIVLVSYRLPILYQWIVAAQDIPGNGLFLSGLGAVNLAFWSFALFFFLLPYVLTWNFRVPSPRGTVEAVEAGAAPKSNVD